MFNAYYQDELSYLRELGREFARANHDAARFLAEQGADPDVERLLEGVAFLTGRIRQKLDDELPELTHALLEGLWPHYLRPIPSMCVVQFTAPAARELQRVPANALVESAPVEGTACRFHTVYPVELPPLAIERVELEHGAPARLRLGLKLRDGVSWDKLGTDRLRLHFSGEPAVSRALHLCLRAYLQEVVAKVGERTVRGLGLEPVGFAADEAVFPFPIESFGGFRLLQEYFAFPAKFMFVDLTGLKALAGAGAGPRVEIEVLLSRLPQHLPVVGASNVQLGCTPAINLFPWDADPVLLDRSRSEYPLRPSGGSPSHYEIHSITRVEGLVRGAREARVYRPLFHFKQSHGGGEAFYQVRRRPALLGTGVDHYLSLTESGSQQGGAETLSSGMLCTNRGLPARLSIGDVRLPGNDVPPGVSVRNLGVPTMSVSPATAGDLHWRLLAHLNLNYSSVVTVEGLRSVFGLYDLRALVDRQAEHAHQRLRDGITSVTAKPATRLLDGVPVRGLGITIEVQEDSLGGTGEAYLLGTILNAFVGQYAGLNTFTVLSLLVQPSGEVYTWPARLGRRPLL